MALRFPVTFGDAEECRGVSDGEGKALFKTTGGSAGNSSCAVGAAAAVGALDEYFPSSVVHSKSASTTTSSTLSGTDSRMLRKYLFVSADILSWTDVPVNDEVFEEQCFVAQRAEELGVLRVSLDPPFGIETLNMRALGRPYWSGDPHVRQRIFERHSWWFRHNVVIFDFASSCSVRIWSGIEEEHLPAASESSMLVGVFLRRMFKRSSLLEISASTTWK
jgi:hypothetical protein